MPFLSVEDLWISFATDEGRISVVEGVSFEIEPGEVVGLVGESGCGKSLTALSMMKLMPSPPSFIDRGRVVLDGINVTELSEREMRRIRGDRVGFVFQEPMTSLNPTFTVGFQLIEALRLHRDVSKAEARATALETLGLVGVSAAERRLKQYPHELSGGLRQRVMIAMALICGPQLLIADEPTTALDVTIQAQVLDLLARLQQKLGMAVLLITHDLGVVAEFCQRVIVMYGGRIVETADARTLFEHPRHPYTHGLMNAMPSLSSNRGKLQTIPGVVPSPGNRPPGCYFADRCERAEARCHEQHPELRDQDGSRFACWNPMP